MYCRSHILSLVRASHSALYSNNVSLDIVDKAFGTLRAPDPLPAKITFNNGAKLSDTGAQLPDHGVSAVPTATSSNNQPAPTAHQSANPIWECEAIPEGHTEVGNYVSKCLIYLLSTCTYLQFSI